MMTFFFDIGISKKLKSVMTYYMLCTVQKLFTFINVFNSFNNSAIRILIAYPRFRPKQEALINSAFNHCTTWYQ